MIVMSKKVITIALLLLIIGIFGFMHPISNHISKAIVIEEEYDNLELEEQILFILEELERINKELEDIKGDQEFIYNKLSDKILKIRDFADKNAQAIGINGNAIGRLQKSVEVLEENFDKVEEMK